MKCVCVFLCVLFTCFTHTHTRLSVFIRGHDITEWNSFYAPCSLPLAECLILPFLASRKIPPNIYVYICKSRCSLTDWAGHGTPSFSLDVQKHKITLKYSRNYNLFHIHTQKRDACSCPHENTYLLPSYILGGLLHKSGSYITTYPLHFRSCGRICCSVRRARVYRWWVSLICMCTCGLCTDGACSGVCQHVQKR